MLIFFIDSTSISNWQQYFIHLNIPGMARQLNILKNCIIVEIITLLNSVCYIDPSKRACFSKEQFEKYNSNGKLLYEEINDCKGSYKPISGKSMFDEILVLYKHLITNNKGNSISEKFYGTNFFCNRGILELLLNRCRIKEKAFVLYRIRGYYIMSFKSTFLNCKNIKSRHGNTFPKSHGMGKAVEFLLSNLKSKEQGMDANNKDIILVTIIVKRENGTDFRILVAADNDLSNGTPKESKDFQSIEIKSSPYSPQTNDLIKEKLYFQQSIVNGNECIFYKIYDKDKKILLIKQKMDELITQPVTDEEQKQTDTNFMNLLDEICNEYNDKAKNEDLCYLTVTFENEEFQYAFFDKSSSFEDASKKEDHELILEGIQRIYESMKF